MSQVGTLCCCIKCSIQGRGGKGSIFVWANGNGGVNDDCAADGYASSIYTISVGSIGVDGRQSPYDEECSAKMVVVYVTDLQGNNATVSSTNYPEPIYLRFHFAQTTTDAYPGRCVWDFGGTSAAAAMVSGIVALALEAK